MIRAAAAAALVAAAPAGATEIFGGAAAHSPCTGWAVCDGREKGRGVDIQFGARSAPLARLLGADLQAYGLGSVNTAGATSFGAVGASLRWDLAKARLYIRPGLGGAYNTSRVGDPAAGAQNRRDLGSHWTFEPELALGVRLSQSAALELAFTHISHLWIAGSNNPGMDTLGGRLVLNF